MYFSNKNIRGFKMNQQTKRENMIEELLSEYVEFIDLGTINYLIELMSKKENKSRKEVFGELGIDVNTLYQPNTRDDIKRRIIKEAFRRLGSCLVIRILYGRMKGLFTNFIVDILSVVANEINTNNELTEFIREILVENKTLLDSVRDVERRKIIEIVSNRLGLDNSKGSNDRLKENV
jgi:hypothetical protein